MTDQIYGYNMLFIGFIQQQLGFDLDSIKDIADPAWRNSLAAIVFVFADLIVPEFRKAEKVKTSWMGLVDKSRTRLEVIVDFSADGGNEFNFSLWHWDALKVDCVHGSIFAPSKVLAY